jgi:hypothetical protein
MNELLGLAPAIRRLRKFCWESRVGLDHAGEDHDGRMAACVEEECRGTTHRMLRCPRIITTYILGCLCCYFFNKWPVCQSQCLDELVPVAGGGSRGRACGNSLFRLARLDFPPVVVISFQAVVLSHNGQALQPRYVIKQPLIYLEQQVQIADRQRICAVVHAD